MTGASLRMRTLQTRLLKARTGSGAVVLPKDIKRIHMCFAKTVTPPHIGPKQFWKNEMIRMKYHNPAVSMTIQRTAVEEPPLLSVHYAPENAPQTSDSATSSAAPVDSSTATGRNASNHAPTERVETIPLRDKSSAQIMEELARLTKAYPVEPTPEDLRLQDTLDELDRKSKVDSELSQRVRAQKKREEDLLAAARGSLMKN